VPDAEHAHVPLADREQDPVVARRRCRTISLGGRLSGAVGQRAGISLSDSIAAVISSSHASAAMGACRAMASWILSICRCARESTTTS
jgi:hypothetical protein